MAAPQIEAIDDVRVREIAELVSPETLLNELPATAAVSATARSARQAIHRILSGGDDRMLLIMGPCSIHDPGAALEYARRLFEQSKRLAAELLIVMRVYFEKPRTTVGWKGLINDPGLDNTFRINEGLPRAQAADRDQQPGAADRAGVPRSDHTAVPRRSGGMGRNRRTHDRIPSASGARIGLVVPDRIQERNRRQRAHRRGRDPRRTPSAPVRRRDQGGSLGSGRNAGQ
jgi:hypothetical protein